MDWLPEGEGLRRGNRIAMLSENTPSYVVLQIAAAKLGAAVACLNWRQSPGELAHCVKLADPRLICASPKFETRLVELSMVAEATLQPLDTEFMMRINEYSDAEPLKEMAEVDAEDIWVILYTSGTTGWPKGAASATVH